MPKLLSFDIGIKNMAYCILSLSGENMVIHDWNILNLMDHVVSSTYKCTCALSPKKATLTNQIVKLCGKKAKYSRPGESISEYFCEKHAKLLSDFIIPTKAYSPAAVKKLKVEDLIKVGNSFGIHEVFRVKKELLSAVLEQIEKKTFLPIIEKKRKTAGETDLITIGRNMARLLDNVDHSGITHVIMENQISTLASRMKTIQGMLAQYYIMKSMPHIEFVSSFNKLKAFTCISSIQGEKDKYKQHKSDGIIICRKMLESPGLQSWTPFFENSEKKDDLADCFLQGVWFRGTKVKEADFRP